MKKRRVLRKTLAISVLTLFLVLPSVIVFANGNPPPPLQLGPGAHYNEHFNSDLMERYFDVYIPYNLNGPAPLLVDMHGFPETKEVPWNDYGFREIADEKGFIYVSPQGIGNSWNGIICCPPAALVAGLNLPDVAFLKNLVSWVADRADVDRSRVYATGFSNGGGMAHQLGLQAADVFAAIAPRAHSFSWLAIHNWPSRPIPVLFVLGNHDDVIDGFEIVTGPAEDGFDNWAWINGCEGDWEYSDYWSPDAWRKVYSNCDGGVKVELLMLSMGHSGNGANDEGVNVARTIWDFLSQWSMP